MDRALYRIIDANFNRAREAARSVEEFCTAAHISPEWLLQGIQRFVGEREQRLNRLKNVIQV